MGAIPENSGGPLCVTGVQAPAAVDIRAHPAHTFSQQVSIADPCGGGRPYGHHPVAIAFFGEHRCTSASSTKRGISGQLHRACEQRPRPTARGRPQAPLRTTTEGAPVPVPQSGDRPLQGRIRRLRRHRPPVWLLDVPLKRDQPASVTDGTEAKPSFALAGRRR